MTHTLSAIVATVPRAGECQKDTVVSASVAWRSPLQSPTWSFSPFVKSVFDDTHFLDPGTETHIWLAET